MLDPKKHKYAHLVQEWIQLNQEGYTLSEIASRHGVNPKTIRTYFKRCGVETRNNTIRYDLFEQLAPKIQKELVDEFVQREWMDQSIKDNLTRMNREEQEAYYATFHNEEAMTKRYEGIRNTYKTKARVGTCTYEIVSKYLEADYLIKAFQRPYAYGDDQKHYLYDEMTLRHHIGRSSILEHYTLNENEIQTWMSWLQKNEVLKEKLLQQWETGKISRIYYFQRNAGYHMIREVEDGVHVFTQEGWLKRAVDHILDFYREELKEKYLRKEIVEMYVNAETMKPKLDEAERLFNSLYEPFTKEEGQQVEELTKKIFTTVEKRGRRVYFQIEEWVDNHFQDIYAEITDYQKDAYPLKVRKVVKKRLVKYLEKMRDL